MATVHQAPDGFLRLPRQTFQGEVYRALSVNARAVLLDVLLQANWRHTEVVWAGERITLVPGQCVTSLDAIAKRCRVSQRNTRTALNSLVSLQFLTKKTTKKTTKAGTLLTVVIPGIFDNPGGHDDKETAQVPVTAVTLLRHCSDSAVTTPEEVKNGRMQEVPPIPPTGGKRSRSLKTLKPTTTEGFDEAWALYPKKVAKAAAFKSWLKIQPDAELQARMRAAIQAQKQTEQWTKDAGQFVPHFATWLNQSRWEDVVEAEEDDGGFAEQHRKALEEQRARRAAREWSDHVDKQFAAGTPEAQVAGNGSDDRKE